jgi:7-cyano-7-deazaguanine synthase in queuosine biosynthesis
MADTLGFLSDDDYELEFRPLIDPPAHQGYFEFPTAEATSFSPDEVILFSGGLDSLAGAINRLAMYGRRVALVSHQSSSKISSVQKYLVAQLRSKFGFDRVLHVPVRVNLDGVVNCEPTHRTRSFLFATLGVVTARLFDKEMVSFFENGIVSLNLPPVAQVVGARATRTTHPQALAGFGCVLSLIAGPRFGIDNPFIWYTKYELIDLIVSRGCGDLIRHTRSCSRVHEMTKLHSHCGRCSQCIDRRFAILAAGQEIHDPSEAYGIDLFEGSRRLGADKEMVFAFVGSASAVKEMTDISFFAKYGEASRVVGFFRESEDLIAGRIFELHQRHAVAVCRVFDQSVAEHAGELRLGTLPADSLLRLMVAQRKEERVFPTSGAIGQANTTEPEIRIAIDAPRRRVVFERWGEIIGVGADLLIALAGPYRQATRSELAPEHYPFTTSRDLVLHTKCESDVTLRRRIFALRNKIEQSAIKAGDSPPTPEAVIENIQWRGYRLNPDRVRIVALSELSGSR